VTHQVHLLDKCDSIIVIDEGRIKAKGSIVQLRNAGIDINYLKKISKSEGENAISTSDDIDTAICNPKIETRAVDGHTEALPVSTSESSDKIIEESKKIDTKQTGLMTSEERVEGIVGVGVYLYFFRIGGPLIVFFCFCIAAAGVASQSYSSFYLSDWGKMSTTRTLEADYCAKSGSCSVEPLSGEENVNYLNIYALFTMLSTCATTLRTTLMVTVGINASRYLHRTLLRRVLAAPVAFFDTTPLGRLLNRFSADITQIDERLGYTIGWCIGLAAALLGIVGCIAYSTNGLFLVIIPFLLVIYYRVQLFFRRTNTELKRLENISRSPIYTEFQEVLQGVTSLRAFGEEDTFAKKLEVRIDRNSAVMILQQVRYLFI
jgi:ABC-type multidrug transport system fused ATPase/permease subunit